MDNINLLKNVETISKGKPSGVGFFLLDSLKVPAGEPFRNFK